jgi:hypothetical protein
MFYLLAALAGALLGLCVSEWTRGLPSPPNHEYCNDRYEHMCRAMRREIIAKEDEIQRLLQGFG